MPSSLVAAEEIAKLLLTTGVGDALKKFVKASPAPRSMTAEFFAEPAATFVPLLIVDDDDDDNAVGDDRPSKSWEGAALLLVSTTIIRDVFGLLEFVFVKKKKKQILNYINTL